MYTYMYVYIYIHMCMYSYMYICICTCMYTYMHSFHTARAFFVHVVAAWVALTVNVVEVARSMLKFQERFAVSMRTPGCLRFL